MRQLILAPACVVLPGWDGLRPKHVRHMQHTHATHSLIREPSNAICRPRFRNVRAKVVDGRCAHRIHCRDHTGKGRFPVLRHLTPPTLMDHSAALHSPTMRRTITHDDSNDHIFNTNNLCRPWSISRSPSRAEHSLTRMLRRAKTHESQMGLREEMPAALARWSPQEVQQPVPGSGQRLSASSSGSHPWPHQGRGRRDSIWSNTSQEGPATPGYDDVHAR